MFIINVSEPITLILLLAATILLIFLGKEVKKPVIPAIVLTVFLVLVLGHSIQYGLLKDPFIEANKPVLLKCLCVDTVMIFITFFSYLWIDDSAAKFYKKKSIDNSLDWFWKNV